MSIFMCSEFHIRSLVKFGIKNKTSFMNWRGEQIKFHENANVITYMLSSANWRSVEARYPGCNGEKPFSFFKEVPLQSPAQIIKGCHCFDYQSHEADDYEMSNARSAIQALINEASRQVEGYEEAAWEIRQ